VAVKILNKARIKQQGMEDKVHREINILQKCSYPHVVRLYEAIDGTSEIFLICEYASGGDLFDYMASKGRLAPGEARHFFQQLISGVEYCHAQRISHRDLNPENILMDATHQNMKIADFGLSNIMRDGEFLKTSCGSLNCAAPEVISNNLYVGSEVDVWSCGVILFALLCGTLPFDDNCLPILMKKIEHGMYTLPNHLSTLAKSLLSRMLEVDPMKRAGIPEIRRHPWFQQQLPPYLRLCAKELLDKPEQKAADEQLVEELINLPFGDAYANEIIASGDKPFAKPTLL
jgi:5'-AMP-activated protein kinase catalytic alpha subunit